ncbi:MAG: hypothetical protein LBU27_01635 [Candidatus Peribacteria bacterium]|jgi:hypothetical protein|nr:hypothetical protein [Candidatus Peribacteria bacterium]
MRRNLLYIAIGILVSVFSVVIINVMRSIGTSLQTIATGGVAPSVVGAVGGLPE